MNDHFLPRPVTLDEAVLLDWPLPPPPADGDKESRGNVLIVAGAREMPGVPILCATAALRAGAGKVTIATPECIATLVAVAMPECRVIGLRESRNGIRPSSARSIEKLALHDAVLIGPGMQDEDAVQEFVLELLSRWRIPKLVLDAYAMGAARELSLLKENSQIPVLITPHAGELAHLQHVEKDLITENPQGHALAAARKWGSRVALKGPVTHIATADRLWQHDGQGNIGLGVSGSGDVLAGIIVGMAARGATLEQAALWGVMLHSLAGSELRKRFGPVGYLSREIAREVPKLMHQLELRQAQ